MEKQTRNSKAQAQAQAKVNVRGAYGNFPRNVFKSKGQVTPNDSNFNLPKDKTFFFKYQGGISKLSCIPSEEVFQTESGQFWVKFNFKNMLLFGLYEQKQLFHKFRVAYINALIESVCDAKDNCHYNIVGSDTPVSDRDITIYELIVMSNANSNNGSINNDDRLLKVINKIEDMHQQYFDDTLEELFDCNLYLTGFFRFMSIEEYLRIKDTPAMEVWTVLFPKPKPNTNASQVDSKKQLLLCLPHTINYDKEQRYWAFLKTVEYLFVSEPPHVNTVKLYLKHFFPNYFGVIESAHNFFKHNSRIESIENNLSRKKKFSNVKTIEHDLKRSVSLTQSPLEQFKDKFTTPVFLGSTWGSPSASSSGSGEFVVHVNRLLSSTSSLSVTEKDTYHTLGASFSHVVDHEIYPDVQKEISTEMYVDAILDNLGFVCKLVGKKDKCYDDNYVVIKISKYLDRICQNAKAMKKKFLLSQTKVNGQNVDKMQGLFDKIAVTSKAINDQRKNMALQPGLKSSNDIQSNVDFLKAHLNEFFAHFERKTKNNIRQTRSLNFKEDFNGKQVEGILVQIMCFVFDVILPFDKYNSIQAIEHVSLNGSPVQV